MALHNLKELIIWKKSIDLAGEVYQIVSEFPSDERFGLTSQIKRAVVSIGSNVAEGAGRNSNKEFIYFLGVAKGSCYELLTQLFIAKTLKLISEEACDILIIKIEELQKMIYSFQNKLNK